MTIQPAENLGALMRYAGLAGTLKGLKGRSLEQARADRKQYAAEYTTSDCCAFARPALLVRFMYEVCEISLPQARECVIALLRHGGRFQHKSLLPAEMTALDILVQNRNVFAAEQVASLICAAAEGTAYETYWRDVLAVLRDNRFIEDDE